MDSNENLIEQSIIALQRCNETLGELSESCCIPERSPNMIKTQSIITELINTIKSCITNKQNIQDCIDTIGKLGSKFGFLYATCCTNTRELLYQSLFKELMLVHENMQVIAGNSH